MPQSSWPDPANGRVVTEAQFEILGARMTEDGLYWKPGDQKPVDADGTGGLVVKLPGGLNGQVRGFAWTSGEGDTLTVAPNSTGQNRLDRVVLRLDRTNWTVRAVVKTGGTSLPPVTRNAAAGGVWEVHLAEVTVPNGATALTTDRVVARPVAVGSRVRVQWSTNRNPSPLQGEIAYEVDTGRWVGWNGTAWVSLGLDDIGDTALALGPKWKPDGSNLVTKSGRMVDIELNLIFGEVKDEVIFKGNVKGLLIATLPSNKFFPTRNKYTLGSLSSGGTVDIQVQPDGKITAWRASENLDDGQTFRATVTYLI
jgi:hypothetical protein